MQKPHQQAAKKNQDFKVSGTDAPHLSDGKLCPGEGGPDQVARGSPDLLCFWPTTVTLSPTLSFRSFPRSHSRAEALVKEVKMMAMKA